MQLDSQSLNSDSPPSAETVDAFKAFRDFEAAAAAGTPTPKPEVKALVAAGPDEAEPKPAVTAPVEDLTDGDEPTSAADEAAAAAEAATEAAKARPSVSRKQRIGQLTRTVHEKDTTIAERDAELAASRQRIADLERGAAPAPKPRVEQQSEVISDHAARPSPEDEKYKFAELDPEFIKDSTRWEARQVLHEERTLAAREATQKQAQTHDEHLREKWGQLIAKGGEEGLENFDVVAKPEGRWAMSRDLFELAVESDVGHKVLHHLANTPDESKRIFTLPVAKQAYEFAKLEARFTQPPSDNDQSVTNPPVVEGRTTPPAVGTKAPTPIKQAKGGASKNTIGAATPDFSAFEAMVKSEEAAKQQRR